MVSQLLVIIFGFLAFYHGKNVQNFEIKLGMSDFFTPVIVGYLSIAIISLNFIACILLLIFKRKWVFFLSGLVLLLYASYNLVLYFKPGSDCGCANILFSNMSIPIQLTLFSFFSILSFLSAISLNKVNNSIQFSPAVK